MLYVLGSLVLCPSLLTRCAFQPCEHVAGGCLGGTLQSNTQELPQVIL